MSRAAVSTSVRLQKFRAPWRNGSTGKGAICSERVELAAAEGVDCATYMVNELGQARLVVGRYSLSPSL